MQRHIRDFHWAVGTKFESLVGKHASDNRENSLKMSRRVYVMSFTHKLLFINFFYHMVFIEERSIKLCVLLSVSVYCCLCILFVWEMAFDALRGVNSLETIDRFLFYHMFMLTWLFRKPHGNFRGTPTGSSIVTTWISKIFPLVTPVGLFCGGLVICINYLCNQKNRRKPGRVGHLLT